MRGCCYFLHDAATGRHGVAHDRTMRLALWLPKIQGNGLDLPIGGHEHVDRPPLEAAGRVLGLDTYTPEIGHPFRGRYGRRCAVRMRTHHHGSVLGSGQEVERGEWSDVASEPLPLKHPSFRFGQLRRRAIDQEPIGEAQPDSIVRQRQGSGYIASGRAGDAGKRSHNPPVLARGSLALTRGSLDLSRRRVRRARFHGCCVTRGPARGRKQGNDKRGQGGAHRVLWHLTREVAACVLPAGHLLVTTCLQ
jgi:hypothetical protein